jgi:putative nucleotidyltransferase with HDIG domain
MSTPTADPKAARVLVVDDDASFGAMVAEVLVEKGYAALSVSRPSDALSRIESGGYAVAVVDLVMPEMGGIELADRIKAVSPDTQVLILTGHAGLDTAIEGIQHGIFDYLQKSSIRISRLQRSIEDAAVKWRLTRENRDLLSRLRESNRLLTALHDTTASLAGEPHLDRLLRGLVRSAKDLCGAEAGRAVLFKPGPELVIVAATGDGCDALPGMRLRPGEGLAAAAAQADAPILLARANDHPAYSGRCDDMPTEAPGFLCAALRRGAVVGTLMLAGRRPEGFGEEHRSVIGSLARQGAVAIENAVSHERSINFFTHTSEILVSFLESLDVFYPGHSRDVAALADLITRRLGMSEADRRNVHFGALLHDIGKVRLDPQILKNEGALTEQQRELMREHPAQGLELLGPITLWEDILPVIHAHHERWDGAGYPRGLAGEEIPLGARVVAVADAFDAMTRPTPHGPQRTPEQAIAELERCAGTQFDPRIVRLFVAEYRQRGDYVR